VNIIIDADSTLITVESLDMLADIALTAHPDHTKLTKQCRAITNSGMTGGLSFNESLSRRLSLFQAKRTHVDELTSCLMNTVSPSAVINKDWFSDHRDDIHVVSGGFEEYLIPVLVERLNLRADHIYGNRFLYDANTTIVGFDTSRLLAQPFGKARFVRRLALPRPIIAVGDESTDAELKAQGVVDVFYAYTETIRRQSVVDIADLEIADFDNLIIAAANDFGLGRRLSTSQQAQSTA
jgi:D-3-phosphoglycerate dehydrogenase